MIFVMPGGSKRKRDSVGEHLRCAVNRVKKSLALTILRNVCGQLSNPGRGSHPRWVPHAKKPVLAYELFLKYGGGGLTRFARPCGQPAYCVRGLSNWLRQLSNPGGFSSPVENIKKRARTFVQALISNMAVRGIRTPIRCRIHTFGRAPSATRTPHHIVFPLLSGTGANVGKYVSPVNQLLQKARLDKLRATCSLNVRNPFLSPVAFPFSLRGNLLCWQTNRKQ